MCQEISKAIDSITTLLLWNLKTYLKISKNNFFLLKSRRIYFAEKKEKEKKITWIFKENPHLKERLCLGQLSIDSQKIHAATAQGTSCAGLTLPLMPRNSFQVPLWLITFCSGHFPALSQHKQIQVPKPTYAWICLASFLMDGAGGGGMLQSLMLKFQLFLFCLPYSLGTIGPIKHY